jgi:flagellar biosynthesis protein FlhF
MRDSRIDEALVEAGIVPEVARDIDRAVQQRIDRAPVVEMARSGISRLAAETLASQTAAEIASRFEVRPGLQPVTALVGPPGAGKTTTLVKLAVTEGLRTGRSTRLISADTQRIGGAEQLRTFAAILGVPFQAVESTAALAQAIDAAPPSGLVLIDTAGYSKASHDELAGGWAEFFSRRQDIDTHLVLTASMQPLVLRKLVDFYRMYRPSKLLFTRLDEVDSLASLYCEAVQQQMPLSYFGTGQLIPEDLEPAGKERVTESLVRQLPADLRAVA